MQIGDLLTLDFNEKYLLLNKVVLNKKNYYLAIGVTQDEKKVDMDDITFFEEIIEDNEIFVKEVFNEKLLEELSDKTMLENYKESKKIEKILKEYYGIKTND